MTVYLHDSNNNKNNKNTNENKKEKRAILNIQASLTTIAYQIWLPLTQPSPPKAVLRPLLTSQGAHSSRARPLLAGELWRCGVRASLWATQDRAPPASGCCLEPRAMCHSYKACGCGLPHPPCWKERSVPKRTQRETINKTKELTVRGRQAPIMNLCF